MSFAGDGKFNYLNIETVNMNSFSANLITTTNTGNPITWSANKLEYMADVTSGVQAQLNNKLNTSTVTSLTNGVVTVNNNVIGSRNDVLTTGSNISVASVATTNNTNKSVIVKNSSPQFYGFGTSAISGGTSLDYQVNSSNDSHLFKFYNPSGVWSPLFEIKGSQNMNSYGPLTAYAKANNLGSVSTSVFAAIGASVGLTTNDVGMTLKSSNLQYDIGMTDANGFNDFYIRNNSGGTTVKDILFYKRSGTGAQCIGLGTSNPTQSVEVGGGLKLGHTSLNVEGSIRYNPFGSFEYNTDGTSTWKTIGAPTAPSFTYRTSIFDSNSTVSGLNSTITSAAPASSATRIITVYIFDDIAAGSTPIVLKGNLRFVFMNGARITSTSASGMFTFDSATFLGVEFHQMNASLTTNGGAIMFSQIPSGISMRFMDCSLYVSCPTPSSSTAVQGFFDCTDNGYYNSSTGGIHLQATNTGFTYSCGTNSTARKEEIISLIIDDELGVSSMTNCNIKATSSGTGFNNRELVRVGIGALVFYACEFEQINTFGTNSSYATSMFEVGGSGQISLYHCNYKYTNTGTNSKVSIFKLVSGGMIALREGVFKTVIASTSNLIGQGGNTNPTPNGSVPSGARFFADNVRAIGSASGIGSFSRTSTGGFFIT